MRAGNIKTPDRRTSPEFHNSSDARRMVIYSPALSAGERQTARQLVEEIPEYVTDLLYKQGAMLIFTSKSLVEALPKYRDHQDEHGDFPYHNLYIGLYIGNEKRLFLTFQIASQIEERNGKPVVHGYKPVFGSKMRTLHHEIGHFIDDILGELGAENTRSRFTDTDNYLVALRADFDRLAINPPSDAELRRLAYYMPEKHNGTAMQGQKKDWRAARREVFAELWVEAQGDRPVGLGKHFPNSFKLVQALERQLRYLHKENALDCPANQNFLDFKAA